MISISYGMKKVENVHTTPNPPPPPPPEKKKKEHSKNNGLYDCEDYWVQ